MLPPTASALLRAAQAATGGVPVGVDSSAVDASSALPLIRLTVARDGQCDGREH